MAKNRNNPQDREQDSPQAEQRSDEQVDQQPVEESEVTPEEPETITEDSSTTVGTNAGPDAVQGTIADQDVQGKAPEREMEGDTEVDTNAGR